MSANFFSTTTPKRPLPTSFFRQSPSPLVSKIQKVRASSGGFGLERQYAANMILIKGLIGVNVAVWGYGFYVRAQAEQGYHKDFIKFLKTMSLNVTEFKNGSYYQAFTSVFTHQQFWHIAANMFTLYYIGRFLAASPIMTPGQIMAIALGAGLTGSLGWIAIQQQKESAGTGNLRQRALGFSGALMGITTVAACLQPTAKVYLYGIVPVPLGLLTAGYAFYDGYYINSENTRVAHAGHIGGIVFGLAYYFLKLRGLRIPGSL